MPPDITDQVSDPGPLVVACPFIMHEACGSLNRIGFRAIARHFSGVSFLHIIYKSQTGREASLFVGRSRGGLVLGTRSVTLDGHTIQLARSSDLDVMSTRIGDHLLIATAEESNDATSVLMSALACVHG